MTDETAEHAADGPDKARIAFLTVLIPALFGLIGGVVSGGVTAYVQLSTKREQYSIDRAREFTKLLNLLKDEDTARLAVLNLWQLYPDDRDRRIITAAAFAVNQPDLVEIITGIDDELEPVADMLHARALSADASLREPALLTLINVDRVRAADLLIAQMADDIEASGGRMRSYSSAGFDPMRELTRLTEADDIVWRMVAEAARPEHGLLFDYVLYRAKRDSTFLAQLAAAYGGATVGGAPPPKLEIANDYLRLSDFDPADREEMVTAAGSYIVAALERPDSDVFDIVDALSALKNSEFRLTLRSALPEAFSQALRTVILSEARPDILRARALEVLRAVAPRTALLTLVRARIDGTPEDKLGRAIDEIVTGGVVAQVQATTPGFALPDCGDMAVAACLEARPEMWKGWLDQQGR